MDLPNKLISVFTRNGNGGRSTALALNNTNESNIHEYVSFLNNSFTFVNFIFKTENMRKLPLADFFIGRISSNLIENSVHLAKLLFFEYNRSI